MPNKIHLVAVSTTGLTIDACIPNTNNTAGKFFYRIPCVA